jgi:hypothetical protein
MLPSSLLHFTNKHKSDGNIGYSAHIDTIEDSLRALSLLLPGTDKGLFFSLVLIEFAGRFEDGDLCSQASKHIINFHVQYLIL